MSQALLAGYNEAYVVNVPWNDDGFTLSIFYSVGNREKSKYF